jgi:small-conductance mechanosensitive channel
MDWTTIVSHISTPRVASTLILVAALVAVRLVAARRVPSLRKLPRDEHRRWLVRIRNLTLLVFLLGLTLIWAEELRTLAVSIVAIAVALVLATKDLLLCLSGAVLRTAGQSFKVGDRIEVKGIRGYVTDHNLLTTTLLEVGPGKTGHMQTGHSVSIPNGVFLNHPVTNETFMAEYVLHVLTVPMKLKGDWQRASRRLLEIATEETAPFAREASRQFKAMRQKHRLNLPEPEPRVSLQLHGPGEVSLVVRMPVPARRRGRIEHQVLSRFLAEFTEPGKPDEEEPSVHEPQVQAPEFATVDSVAAER